MCGAYTHYKCMGLLTLARRRRVVRLRPNSYRYPNPNPSPNPNPNQAPRQAPAPGGSSPARAAGDQRQAGGSTLTSRSAAGTAADPLRTALCRASSSSSGASDSGVGDSGHERRLNLFRSLVARQTVSKSVRR